VRRINLITGYDDKTDLTMVRSRLEELKASLRERDVLLDFRWSEDIHDREIRIDNGWTVKIGRGLDFYQRPDGWSSIGASDFGLRKCLETKVDIFWERGYASSKEQPSRLPAPSDPRARKHSDRPPIVRVCRQNRKAYQPRHAKLFIWCHALKRRVRIRRQRANYSYPRGSWRRGNW
jgi:hypothetical protein